MLPVLLPPQFIIFPFKFLARYVYSSSLSIINILDVGISLYIKCLTDKLFPDPELPNYYHITVCSI